jgi:hypothetical protein
VTQQRILFTEQLRWNPLYLGFIILGDSAFANNDVMVSIYKRRHLPEAAERFNGVMCSIRTCMTGQVKLCKTGVTAKLQ